MRDLGKPERHAAVEESEIAVTADLDWLNPLLRAMGNVRIGIIAKKMGKAIAFPEFHHSVNLNQILTFFNNWHALEPAVFALYPAAIAARVPLRSITYSRANNS